MLEHEPRHDGTCSCGDRGYPCFTLRAVERISPRIFVQIEKYGSMSTEQLDRVMYPDTVPRVFDDEGNQPHRGGDQTA